jgi:hypothetical protein
MFSKDAQGKPNTGPKRHVRPHQRG